MELCTLRVALRWGRHFLQNNKISSRGFTTLLGPSARGQNPMIPVKIYLDADLQKVSIVKDNKGKAGIYRWTNKNNGKIYIGSAVDLTNIFFHYYSLKRISDSNMTICKALLKYGYTNFQLEILEYCEPQNIIAREQYYLDLLQSEYNILKTAGSTLGYKHNEEAILKISKYREGREHTEETRKK